MSWTIQGSNSSRSKRFFSSDHHPDQLWFPPSLLFSRLGAFSLVKQLVHEVEHSPLSSAEVKNGWNCASLPPCMPSWHVQGQLHVFYLCLTSCLYPQYKFPYIFFSGGREVSSVGLYHVVNLMFFLIAYSVIRCLIRYVCCVLCCLLPCNIYAGLLIRSEIKLIIHLECSGEHYYYSDAW